MEHWLKTQLNEAHKLLSDMGVPDRVTRPDYNRGTGKMEDKEFSIGVAERIQWVRTSWQPKASGMSDDAFARLAESLGAERKE